MASMSMFPVRGSCGRYPTVPDLRTEPAAGWASPASTLASVVLPAPFRPTRPMRSPADTWNDASSSSRRAPARSSISLATIMTDAPRTKMDRPLPWGVSLVRGEEHGIQSTVVSPSAGLSDSGSVSRMRMARKARGMSRSTASRGSGTVRKRAGRLGQVFLQPGVVAQPGGRPLVPAQHHGVEPVRAVPAEHLGRGVGGGPQRRGGLVLPAPGEALLRPAARRAAAVHRPAARLRAHQPGRRAREHPGRITAQADQQDADRTVRRGVRRERLGGRRAPPLRDSSAASGRRRAGGNGGWHSAVAPSAAVNVTAAPASPVVTG